MLDIYWDAYGLQSVYAGIGRYAWHIARNLEERGHPPHILPSVPVADPFAKWLTAEPAKAGRGRNLKPLALLRSKALLEQATRRGQKAIVHGLSNYNIPKHASHIRSVLTLHDLIPLLDSSASSKTLRYFLQWQLPRSFQRTDLILCSSRWSQKTLEDLYPACRQRTALLMPGRPEFKKVRKGEAFKHGKCLLTISRSEPYKRLTLIPEILRRLPQEISWSVVCDAEGYAQLAPAAAKDSRLQLATSLPDHDLEKLWQTTDLYVHPSLMEGYGLPIAEALSFGIPSLVTSGSGVDEVLGEAGERLLAEASASEWASTLEKMLREDWNARCIKQYESLPTWDDVGKQVLIFYDTVK